MPSRQMRLGCAAGSCCRGLTRVAGLGAAGGAVGAAGGAVGTALDCCAVGAVAGGGDGRQDGNRRLQQGGASGGSGQRLAPALKLCLRPSSAEEHGGPCSAGVARWCHNGRCSSSMMSRARTAMVVQSMKLVSGLLLHLLLRSNLRAEAGSKGRRRRSAARAQGGWTGLLRGAPPGLGRPRPAQRQLGSGGGGGGGGGGRPCCSLGRLGPSPAPLLPALPQASGRLAGGGRCGARPLLAGSLSRALERRQSSRAAGARALQGCGLLWARERWRHRSGAGLRQLPQRGGDGCRASALAPNPASSILHATFLPAPASQASMATLTISSPGLRRCRPCCTLAGTGRPHRPAVARRQGLSWQCVWRVVPRMSMAGCMTKQYNSSGSGSGSGTFWMAAVHLSEQQPIWTCRSARHAVCSSTRLLQDASSCFVMAETAGATSATAAGREASSQGWGVIRLGRALQGERRLPACSSQNSAAPAAAGASAGMQEMRRVVAVVRCRLCAGAAGDDAWQRMPRGWQLSRSQQRGAGLTSRGLIVADCVGGVAVRAALCGGREERPAVSGCG
jgi:hypothetical protein